MNEVTEERKEAVTKSLAIVGFIAIILFAVWLAVQIVTLIPGAFSSLASIADGVSSYNGNDAFIATTASSVLNAGEPFTVSWTKHKAAGTYAFSYECTEGVALQARNLDGEIVDLACNTALDLEGATSVEIEAQSEKQRFTDVAYSVLFTGKNDTSVTEATTAQFTVVNAAIPTSIVLADETEEEETEEVVETPEPEVAGETTDTPAPTPVPQPEVVEEVIYAIPTSDPNGTVDLAVRFLGVGILSSGNNFVQTGTIDVDQTGAFQFEVKNDGTKTSKSWDFVADLPSGIEYESSTQDPLKPNERAVITIGFDGLSQTGVEQFGAEIDVDNDVRSSNNSFISAVKVVK